MHPRTPVGNECVPLTVSKLPPRMTVAEARQRLDLTGFPFVFNLGHRSLPRLFLTADD
nr:hypothetical protein OG999_05920 [Streptomyces sp. NBC_00886]